MKKNPRVLLDADGILFDFVAGIIDVISNKFHIDLTNEDFPDWDVFARLDVLQKEKHTGSRPQLRWDDEHIWKNTALHEAKRENFCLNLPPLPGAQDAVKKMLESGIDLFIVTSHFGGNKTWVHERDTSLFKNFDIPAKRIVHTASKYLVKGDVFIDDKDEHCIEWRRAHPAGEAFLWTTPHNLNDGKGLRRLSGWEEILDILRIKS